MTLALTGIGVTSGIALGEVHRLTPGELELPEYEVEADAVDSEVDRLVEAAGRAERYIDQMLKRLRGSAGESAVEFLDAHRLMLRDELLLGAACQRIREERINAEWALMRQAEALQREFERMDDAYLALRREDLEQVVRLIQRELAEQPVDIAQVPHQLDHTIVVAPQLSPADLALLYQRRVAGLVTEHGGPWSHTAILARSLEIPMIVGVHRALELLEEGEPVILDGHYGVVLATAEDGLHRHYREKRQASLRHRAGLLRYLDRPDRTRDGWSFTLLGNAELPAEIERCRQSHAAGIGLMRTEYLFMQGDLPDEDSQYSAYRQALEAMGGKCVTIRTLDAGGEKLSPALARLRGPNPALGMRGVRLSLALGELFARQIRAILRASAHGPVQILLPMLTTAEEVRQVRRLIASCREQLRAEGRQVDPEVPLGGMIEIPAAALDVANLAAELDFLSVGTNDLIQYLLAIDRQDELVSHLYDPMHPAVLRLLSRIIELAGECNRPVTVCGELAGDERYTRLLLGLGLEQFSMPPGHLPLIKKMLVESHAGRCREIVRAYLERYPGDRGEVLLEELAEHGG